MNRIDRLTAILLLLQARKRTAGEIAQRFEVSRRTVLRDIQALCEMGIPIAADLGTTGGYSLPADYSLPPLALTLHEALLLRLALSGLSQLGEIPFKQERESLLAKIQTLLPRDQDRVLEQFEETLSLDIPSRLYPTPFLNQLLESAHAEQWVAVTYRSERGVSQQTLLPKRVRSEVGLWYCEAYSLEHQEVRVYRVDRFQDVRVTSVPSQHENLASTILHTHPAFPGICIRLTARGVLRLEHDQYLAPRVQPADDGGGWLRLHLRPQEYEWLVRVLLDLGTDAEVHSPEELCQRVLQVAQEIARHYTKR